MSIINALASVAVADFQRAVTWYPAVPGRPPDTRPILGVAKRRFERGGGLQVYQLPRRAGHGSFTLAVTSIDDAVAHARDFGLDTSERASSDKVKTLMVTDLDGNHIAFAETLDPRLAR